MRARVNQEDLHLRIAPAIVVSDEDRPTLERWARGRTTPARLGLRAEIVLLSTAGRLNKEIATELNTGMKTVCQCRTRFAKQGLAGIERDAPRGGRPSMARAYSPDGKTLVTAGRDHTLRLWDVATHEKTATLTRAPIDAVAPDGPSTPKPRKPTGRGPKEQP
jgi:hypothetical protein